MIPGNNALDHFDPDPRLAFDPRLATQSPPSPLPNPIPPFPNIPVYAFRPPFPSTRNLSVDPSSRTVCPLPALSTLSYKPRKWQLLLPSATFSFLLCLPSKKVEMRLRSTRTLRSFSIWTELASPSFPALLAAPMIFFKTPISWVFNCRT